MQINEDDISCDDENDHGSLSPANSSSYSYSNSDSSGSDNGSSSSDENFHHEIAVQTAQKKTAEKITNIAFKAKDLIDHYVSKNTDAFVRDPIKVFDEVGRVCDEMKEMWEQYHSDLASIEKDKELYEQKIDQKFRKVYMDVITETFADELDDLRHGRVRSNVHDQNRNDSKRGKHDAVPDILMQDNVVMSVPGQSNEGDGEEVHVDVKVLADMLESGMEGWNITEKELFLQDCWRKNSFTSKSKMIEKELTPHERRRMEIFGK
jgi:hypothetical protein